MSKIQQIAFMTRSSIRKLRVRLNGKFPPGLAPAIILEESASALWPTLASSDNQCYRESRIWAALGSQHRGT
jgi:hypothetical protein